MIVAASSQGLNLLIFWVVVGGIAGWLAGIVAGTHARQGCLINIAVGIIGGIVGGWIFHNLGIETPVGHPFIGAVVTSFVGATVFLLILRLLGFDRR